EALAVGEDADVLAQPTLIIEDVATQLRRIFEQRAERLPDRAAGRAHRRLRGMRTQPGCEMNLCHRTTIRMGSNANAVQPPSAAAMAASAASALEPPGPPACAMSGRPPPPLPPSASAPLRTRSTAE